MPAADGTVVVSASRVGSLSDALFELSVVNHTAARNRPDSIEFADRHEGRAPLRDAGRHSGLPVLLWERRQGAAGLRGALGGSRNESMRMAAAFGLRCLLLPPLFAMRPRPVRAARRWRRGRHSYFAPSRQGAAGLGERQRAAAAMDRCRLPLRAAVVGCGRVSGRRPPLITAPRVATLGAPAMLRWRGASALGRRAVGERDEPPGSRRSR